MLLSCRRITERAREYYLSSTSDCPPTPGRSGIWQSPFRLEKRIRCCLPLQLKPALVLAFRSGTHICSVPNSRTTTYSSPSNAAAVRHQSTFILYFRPETVCASQHRGNGTLLDVAHNAALSDHDGIYVTCSICREG